MELELNRIKYVILNILDKHGAKEPMRSMSCEEIQEIENYSAVTTIYKHVRTGIVTKSTALAIMKQLSEKEFGGCTSTTSLLFRESPNKISEQ